MKENNNPSWGIDLSSAGYGWHKDARAGEDYADLNMQIELPKSELDPSFNTKFLLNDGTVLRTIADNSGGGAWGRSGTPIGGENISQPLPDKMHLVFLEDSIVGNQYTLNSYQLDTDLPKEALRQLLTTQHRGITDNLKDGSKNIYSGIELAFAPKGWVMLFAIGPGIRKELASWQAKQIYPTRKVLDEVTDGEYGRRDTSHELGYYQKAFRNTHPELYHRLETGEWKISSDWYKMMQTKFPWNLEVIGDDIKWTGEYYIEYANTDRYETLSDQIAQHKTELKPVPTKITTWIIDSKTNKKYYVEFHMFPIPKWLTPRYMPYYQDPNLTYFFKRFQHLYPNRSLNTNNQPAKPEEFATLKIHLTYEGNMDNIYLQKGAEKLPIESAYEYYISEVDPERGGYLPYQDGVDYYRTLPKIKDLSNPLFVDLD